MGDEDFPVGSERDPPSPKASADKSADIAGGGQGQEGPSTGSGRTGGGAASRRAAIDGDERICASKHRPLQVTRAGKRKLFGKKARKAFLEWFAATGNVVWSAARVGFSDKTVWRHRMNDPRFAEGRAGGAELWRRL